MPYIPESHDSHGRVSSQWTTEAPMDRSVAVSMDVNGPASLLTFNKLQPVNCQRGHTIITSFFFVFFFLLGERREMRHAP